jgi:hypothetical protein
MNSLTKLRLMSRPQFRRDRDLVEVSPLPVDDQPLFRRRDVKPPPQTRIRQLIEAQERP